MVAYAQTREDEAPALDDASVGEPVGRAWEELRRRSALGEERHEDVGRHLHDGRAAVDDERAYQPVVEGDLHAVNATLVSERYLPTRRGGPSRGRCRGDDCEQHSGGEWGRHASTHTIASRLRLVRPGAVPAADGAPRSPRGRMSRVSQTPWTVPVGYAAATSAMKASRSAAVLCGLQRRAPPVRTGLSCAAGPPLTEGQRAGRRAGQTGGRGAGRKPVRVPFRD